MSVENGKEDEGHSTPELDDNAPEESRWGKHSSSPVIHLGVDGEEVYEDGEPVEQEEEKYEFYKLERLQRQLEHASLLASYSRFIQSVDEQVSTIQQKEFDSRFKGFLREFLQPAPSPEIIDGLFHLAIEVKKEITAWKNTVQAIKSDDFSNSLKFLRAEVRRFERIRKELGFRPKMPSWMSAWERLWMEAFCELQENIETQLRGARVVLENLSKLAKLGRTDVESLALLLNRNSIQKSIDGTTLAKASNITLAAFAYGGRLVRSMDDTNDSKGKYVDLIKARIARAERSKAKITIFATLIHGMLLRSASSAEKRTPAEPK